MPFNVTYIFRSHLKMYFQWIFSSSLQQKKTAAKKEEEKEEQHKKYYGKLESLCPAFRSFFFHSFPTLISVQPFLFVF